MTFNNRTAFITGAAGRIGRATAAEFAKLGVKLVLADIDMEKLNAAVEELKKITPHVRGIYMDVTVPESMETGFKKVMEETGRIDILVNNAGEDGCEIQYVGEISILEVLDLDADRLPNAYGVKLLSEKASS